VLEVALAAALVVVAALAVVLLAVLAARLRRQPTTGSVLDLLVATAATAAAATGALIALVEDREGQTRLVTLLAVVLTVLGLLVTCQPALVWLRRRRIRRLAEALGDLPPLGRLEASLALALGDPEVRVAYWLPESRRYVDADGRSADTSTWPVTLVRGGRPLAAVRVGRHSRDAGELVDLIGPAARLAVDSERQQAELRLQLAELRASRQRIVEAEDKTRRRIERDLHDIVQAELLGAMIDLSLVESQAGRSGDTGTVDEATRLREEVRGVVAAVRGFAQGVHPAALESMGLPAALEAMAQDAGVVITVDHRLAERPPREVEQVIYRLVHDAAQRAEAGLHVQLEPNGPGTRLRIAGYPAPVPESLADRAGALGGTLEIDGGCLIGTLP
jgi:signal transduction histidine kinase